MLSGNETKAMSGGQRSYYRCKLSQKEAKYEPDTTWVLFLYKMKSHGQARFTYNDLGKKVYYAMFYRTKNRNDSTIDQYGLLLEIDTNLGIARDSSARD